VPRPAVMAALLGSLDDHPLYEALAEERRVPLFAAGWAKVLSDPRLKAGPPQDALRLARGAATLQNLPAVA